MGVSLISAGFGMWRSGLAGWAQSPRWTGRMWILLRPGKRPPAHSGPFSKTWHLELVVSGSGEGDQGFYSCFPKASGSSKGKLGFPVYSVSEGSMFVTTLSTPAISQLCGAACLESLLKTPFFFHVYVCVHVRACNMHVCVFACVRVGRCV